MSIYSVGWQETVGEEHIYQQNLWEIMRNNNIPLETTPYKLFCNDLMQQLQTWVTQGDRLILMMDANEHVLNNPFCCSLQDEMVVLDLEE